MNLFHFFILFIYKVGVSLTIIGVILAGFCYYQNDISPATLPYYTLSNGEKIVRFQTMSHIASPEFYTDVRNNILRSKRWWYVLFYEGVKPGSMENTKKFNQALWINLSEDLYSRLSTLYGIVAQDNDFFLWIVNNKDYNIDLNLNEIMAIYEKKSTSTEENSMKILWQDFQDTEDLITQSIENLSEKELELVRYVNQALMNMIIKNEGVRNTILNVLGNEDIFSVILDDRNEYLVSNILLSPEEKIFVIYGLMHFEWVFELLVKADPNWKILNVWEYQVIR